MAAGSLLALLDDIASVLDDVAAMTKVAAKKTAGVLGDDLALNAQQVTGVRASRELPVVWGVAKGSLVNKVILVPAALLLSIFASWAVTPLLMLGGLYLCFEGCEKLAHRFWHRAAHQTPEDEPPADAAAPPANEADMLQLEKQKIRGAIRTDFILSAEIIVIALGVVQGQPWMKQLLVLALIGMVMTVGVYGLVAGIVKLDDLGFHLSRKGSALLRKTGRGIVALAPWLMKFLSLAGTVAMFLVGGGIIVHGLPVLARLAHQISEASSAAAGLGSLFFSGLTGVVAGALALAAVTLAQRVLGRAG